MTSGEAAAAVIVAGDALVDLTPATTTLGTPAYEPHPGGSCLNVAVGLARLDVPTAFLGRLSRDAFGVLLRDHLQGSGVLDGWSVATDDLSTLAFVHLTPDGQATYSFHADGAADRGLLPEHLRELPPGAALHLGSIALAFEPVASTLEGLLQREAGSRLISLDPNIRPALIADRDAYLRRFATWIADADIVKVSSEDLAWLYPDTAEDDVVAGWLADDVGLVLVTYGADGARAVTPSAGVRVQAPATRVVDTVGAGDAFTAGALTFLHETGALDRAAVRALDAASLERLLTFACGVAADTCTRRGADPPRRGQL
jgi:fructokinase